MPLYKYLGDRLLIADRDPLRRGDTVELSDGEAAFLVDEQKFPFVLVEEGERANPAEEVNTNGAL